MSDHHTLLGSVSQTLREAGLPLAKKDDGTAGAVVSSQAHGVTVVWQTGVQSAAVSSPATGTVGRAHGAAAIRSPHFRSALRLAALLAEAGYHSDHTGDRVLVSNPAPR
ncbi:hypothetical protein [Kitasatospora kifunensis]|uniref:Uncharacterized protein n=1 Tax=Kitasatospora kifunensis TaxID=58351 RepID=A0A7W7R9Q7_KITKI|nr:hypothetical protein [Kitasatospora kifunensis]MBB4927683.1 hypothetical protein [Kitasatospora kifunensis]